MNVIIFCIFLQCSLLSALIPELQIFTQKLHDIQRLLPQEHTQQKKLSQEELDKEIEKEEKNIKERWKQIKERISKLSAEALISSIHFLPAIKNRMATLQNASRQVRDAYIKNIYDVLTDIKNSFTPIELNVLGKNKSLFFELLEDFEHLQPTEEAKLEKTLKMLQLPADRLVGPATTKIMTARPPYELISGNVILQVEVLNQFLYVDAFQEKNYYDQIATLQDYVPENSRNQDYILNTIVQPYINRLVSYSIHNKELQQRLKKHPVKNENIGGGAASCGYHALKNALYTIQAISSTNKSSSTDLGDTFDITEANKLFGAANINLLLFGENKPGKWRQFALKKNLGDTNGEWLNENGLKKLWDQKVKPHLKNFSECTVYGSPKAVYETSFGIDIVYRETSLSTLFKGKKDYIHTFILGGANDVYGQPGNEPIKKLEQSLHWVTLVVAVVQNKVHYIILDSLNMPRYQQKGQLKYNNAPQYSDQQTIQRQENDIISYHINDMIAMIEKARE